MIGIVQATGSNTRSLSNCLDRLGVAHRPIHKAEEFRDLQQLILPGVGSVKAAMLTLERQGMVTALRETSLPILGICLGMQLLFEESAEDGGVPTLGLLAGAVSKMRGTSERPIPHMGWNLLRPVAHDSVLESYVYFVHSYVAPITDATVAIVEYDQEIPAIVQSGRVTGLQFHPEKSGKAGLRILRRYLGCE